MRQHAMKVLSVHEMTLHNTQHRSTSTSSSQDEREHPCGCIATSTLPFLFAQRETLNRGVKFVRTSMITVYVGIDCDSLIWITVRGLWILIPPSPIKSCLSLAMTGQHKYNMSSKQFPAFFLKSLSYSRRRTPFGFLVICRNVVLLHSASIAPGGCWSVSRSNVSDRDTQRPSPVTRDVSWSYYHPVLRSL